MGRYVAKPRRLAARLLIARREPRCYPPPPWGGLPFKLGPVQAWPSSGLAAPGKGIFRRIRRAEAAIGSDVDVGIENAGRVAGHLKPNRVVILLRDGLFKASGRSTLADFHCEHTNGSRGLSLICHSVTGSDSFRRLARFDHQRRVRVGSISARSTSALCAGQLQIMFRSSRLT